MWRTHVRRNPQTQQETPEWGGEIATGHPSHPARIAIKGDLARTPILAQEGDHRFQGGLFVEIFSRLGGEGNRSASIHKRLFRICRAIFTTRIRR
jgi:hypothetical protein